MPEQPLKKIANDTGKVLTLQAALTGGVAVAVSHAFAFTPTEVGAVSSLISLVLVWVVRRVVNRMDADEAAREPTRALVLLRDKTEQEALAMDENDPRRAQRMRQAAALTEEIYRRTVETEFVILSGNREVAQGLPSAEDTTD